MQTKTTRRAILAALTLGPMAATAPASAQQEVNVYTYREPDLIKPLFDAFTKDTGIKVNAIYGRDGLEQRIASEGANSPADVLITVDIGRLQQAVDLGIAQPVKSAILEKDVPPQFRDASGLWFGLSARARVIYASKERVKENAITYEDLADPKWKGKICIRSGQHSYNIGLFAAVISHLGEAKAEEWLKGVKANLAKKPSGGDREVARDIAAGQCDIGLANTYYFGLMANKDPEKKPWTEATKVILPTFKNGGTHINVSGALVAKNAPHRENAIKLVEWMTEDKAQNMYADVNYEYPIKPGVKPEAFIASFGPLKPDTIPLTDIMKNRKLASTLVDKVGFDN